MCLRSSLTWAKDFIEASGSRATITLSYSFNALAWLSIRLVPSSATPTYPSEAQTQALMASSTTTATLPSPTMKGIPECPYRLHLGVTNLFNVRPVASYSIWFFTMGNTTLLSFISHRYLPTPCMPQYLSQDKASKGSVLVTLCGNSIATGSRDMSSLFIRFLMSNAVRLPSAMPLVPHEALKHCHLRMPISLDAPKVFCLWHTGQFSLTEYPTGNSISITYCLRFMLTPLLLCDTSSWL